MLHFYPEILWNRPDQQYELHVYLFGKRMNAYIRSEIRDSVMNSRRKIIAFCDFGVTSLTAVESPTYSNYQITN